jgi:hypothetical protein
MKITARTQEHPPPKMTIEVYTVDRYGTVRARRAAVVVPHDYEPAPDTLIGQLPPCACPVHREAGAAR